MTPDFKTIHDESEQLYPERSTTAFITYHPASNYFSAYELVRSEYIPGAIASHRILQGYSV